MTTLLAAGRVWPVALGRRRAWLLIERNLFVYRSGWLVILSGFFEPLFYLLSIGFGLGGLVGDVPGPNGELIPYAVFVAPALLATASMNGAIAESTFNVFFKLNYAKTYDAVLATPMAPGDVALGEIGWAVIRSSLYAIGFTVVIAVLQLIQSPWAILRDPGGDADGVRVRGGRDGRDDVHALVAGLRPDQPRDPAAVPVLGDVLPVSAYPPLLQLIVQVTPLYQGVDLIRALVTGHIDISILVHVVYLTVMGLIGLMVVARRLNRLLLK